VTLTCSRPSRANDSRSSPFAISTATPDTETIAVADVRASVLGSLERLGTQPDLLFLHNPFVVPRGQLKPFWQVLEKMKDDGELTASLAVSNWRMKDYDELLSFAKYKPVVNRACHLGSTFRSTHALTFNSSFCRA
jgi:diketogulonate reductase-like aldo/keto reductase